MMDDSSTRHRRRPPPPPPPTSLVQVPSGDSQDNDDDDDDDHRSKPQSKTTSRRRQQRRRRRRDETPFAVLVFQVGVTLLLVSFAAFFLYRQVYPYDPNAGMVEEIVYVVDDDDGTTTTTKDDDDRANRNNLILQQQGGNEHKKVDDEDDADSKRRRSRPRPSSPDYTAEDEAKLALLMKQQKKDMEEAQAKQKAEKIAQETPPPLPKFDLSDAAQWDAFGFAATITAATTTTTTAAAAATTTTMEQETAPQNIANNNLTFWQIAEGLRERYAETYGNENIARMLLDKGTTTFFQKEDTNDAPADIVATACRLQQAQKEKRPFRVAFGGYSVTAGRGNQFEQSFPFQMQRLLESVFKAAGIPDLQVTNAAIGGCPAFPYGWCMANFWGTAPDVVSWDYSMNEAGGVPEGLEAYIRHLLSTYNATNSMPPKLIVKDTYLAAQRRDLLGAYANFLRDPIVLHTGPAVKPFLERKEEHNPIGFQEWRKFGAPVGSPGQALHHPALKEHEMIGWMLAMHFLTALEYLQSHSSSKPLSCASHLEPTPALPRPVTGSSNTTKYDGILFGHPKTSDEWEMNPIHCRTTFQPIVNGDLSELVVSGTTAEDLDVTLPKSQMYYNEGWTFDLSEEEKQTKRKLSLYENGLGFIDSKEAYYGIYESPTMRLLLPYEHTDAAMPSRVPQVGKPAADWFESIVVCQVNEKRDATACNMGSDLGFIVGGANTTNTTRMMKDTGTLYLGKPVCLKIPIPSNATLTSHNELSSVAEQRLEHDQVGLLVEFNVTNPHIAHVHQACSVSHVIWEQRQTAMESNNVAVPA
jgi:hypothetical protein